MDSNWIDSVVSTYHNINRSNYPKEKIKMIFGLNQRDLVFVALMFSFVVLMFAMLLIELYKIYLRNRNKKNGNGPE